MPREIDARNGEISPFQELKKRHKEKKMVRNCNCGHYIEEGYLLWQVGFGEASTATHEMYFALL